MRLLFSFICVAMIFSGCSKHEIIAAESQQQTFPTENVQLEYYNVQNNQDGTYSYTVYDKSGNVILVKNNENTCPEIQMRNEYIVDIMVGRGTGLTEHIYCDVKNGRVSEPFHYVYAEIGENILRMDFSDGAKLEKRCLIVHNVFDNTSVYAPVNLDFAPIDTPVLSAQFLENGKSLEITYLAGAEATENKVVVDLEYKTGD